MSIISFKVVSDSRIAVLKKKLCFFFFFFRRNFPEFYLRMLEIQKFSFISFQKIIFYWFCYYGCPNFSPFATLSTQQPPLPQAVHTPLVHGSCVEVLWLLHFLYYTLHLHGYSVTTYLYFFIPSPLHPFPHIHLPTGNHQNTLSTILSLFLFA